MQTGSIKIAIAEDHIMVRQFMSSALNAARDLHIVLEAGNGMDLLRQMETERVDIVILDVRMPVLNGLQTLAQLKKQYPVTKVIMISGFAEENMAAEYINRGASSYLSKSEDMDKLISSIYILAGKTAPDHTWINEYTQRELQVIGQIKQHKTSREIAGILGLSLRTVQNYRQNILQKAGAKNVIHLLDLLKNRKNIL